MTPPSWHCAWLQLPNIPVPLPVPKEPGILQPVEEAQTSVEPRPRPSGPSKNRPRSTFYRPLSVSLYDASTEWREPVEPETKTQKWRQGYKLFCYHSMFIVCCYGSATAACVESQNLRIWNHILSVKMVQRCLFCYNLMHTELYCVNCSFIPYTWSDWTECYW